MVSMQAFQSTQLLTSRAPYYLWVNGQQSRCPRKDFCSPFLWRNSGDWLVASDSHSILGDLLMLSRKGHMKQFQLSTLQENWQCIAQLIFTATKNQITTIITGCG